MKNILTEALVNSVTNVSFICSYTNSAKLRLYISYPITWVITLVAHGICFMIVRKKIRRVA